MSLHKYMLARRDRPQKYQPLPCGYFEAHRPHAIERVIDTPRPPRKRLIDSPPGWFDNILRAFEEDR